MQINFSNQSPDRIEKENDRRLFLLVISTLFLLVLLGLTTACQNSSAGTTAAVTPSKSTSTPLPTPSPTAGISPEARSYLVEVFDLVETYSINRDKVDWDALKQHVYEHEKDAVTTADTYESVRYILVTLNDHHSHFHTPDEAQDFDSAQLDSSVNPPPVWEMVEGKLAYLAVPSFASGDFEVNDSFGIQLNNIVHRLDEQSPCGWVIDLRENFGGNLPAMIAGVGALIGEGSIGGLRHVDGTQDTLLWQGGKLTNTDGTTEIDLSSESFKLEHSGLPIAILIGPYTTSAGEMLALAFKGQPKVTFFGQETNGLTTGNRHFYLSDGSLIFITDSVFIDRTGEIFGGPIAPDIPLSSSSDKIPEPVLDWFNQEFECQQP